jgi:hypothetical protein
VHQLKKIAMEVRMCPKQKDLYPVKIFFLQFDRGLTFSVHDLIFAADPVSENGFTKINFFQPLVDDH